MKSTIFLNIMVNIFLVHAVSNAEHALKLSFYGNNRTHEKVILQELQLTKSQFLSNQMHQERLWFLRKNLFNKIDFYVKSESEIMVIVKEKSLLSADPLWDYSGLFGMSGGVEISLFNMRGIWDRLKLGIQGGGLQGYQLSYESPRILGFIGLTGRLLVYHHENRYLYPDDVRQFLLQETGGGGELFKQVGRKNQAGIGWTQEWIRVDEPDILHQGRKEMLRHIRLFWERDGRDWPIYTRSGFYLSTEWTRTLRDNKKMFDRLKLDFRVFRPLWKRNILAFQSLFFYSDGSVPVYKRLHLGGSSSLRGYSTGFRAGDNEWLSTIEYRFPIVYERNPASGLHVGYAGVLFFDAGTAWYHDQSFDWHHVYGSAGVGVHAIWDRWVLRAEYGHRGQGWGFITSGIGAKF